MLYPSFTKPIDSALAPEIDHCRRWTVLTSVSFDQNKSYFYGRFPTFAVVLLICPPTQTSRNSKVQYNSINQIIHANAVLYRIKWLECSLLTFHLLFWHFRFNHGTTSREPIIVTFTSCRPKCKWSWSNVIIFIQVLPQNRITNWHIRVCYGLD